MASVANYAATPRTGSVTVFSGDGSRVAPTAAGTVFTAGSSGSRIDGINLEATNTVTSTMARLFIFNGTTYSLIKEIPITANTPSGTSAVWSSFFTTATNPEFLPITLPTTYSLRATLNDMQLVKNATIDSIALSQSISANAYALLNSTVYGTGTNGAGTALNASAIVTTSTPTTTYATLTADPYVATTPAQVTIYSSSNLSAVTFTLVGTDGTGALVTESITGPNNTTVYSTKIYNSVHAIYSNGTATSMQAGVGSVAVLPVATPIQLFSSGTSNSGVTFTITGAAPGGGVLSESLVGPGVGAYVTSVNSYKTITSVKASASTTALTIGTPPLVSGVSFTAIGGDF